jgi:hypothetical protein
MDDFDEYGGPPFDEEDKPKTVHVPYIPPGLHVEGAWGFFYLLIVIIASHLLLKWLGL